MRFITHPHLNTFHMQVQHKICAEVQCTLSDILKHTPYWGLDDTPGSISGVVIVWGPSVVVSDIPRWNGANIPRCFTHFPPVLPWTERGYLYIMARHCLPSPPHRPTSCQYEEISCGGPQWITLSTFWMSIPIPNATVATMHRNEKLLPIARLIIRDWLAGSVFLLNISTNLLWTVLGTPSYAWWASSRFNQAYISLTMLMLLEAWREASYKSVFKYETLFRLLSLTIITQLQRLSTVRCRYKALNSPKY